MNRMKQGCICTGAFMMLVGGIGFVPEASAVDEFNNDSIVVEESEPVGITFSNSDAEMVNGQDEVNVYGNYGKPVKAFSSPINKPTRRSRTSSPKKPTRRSRSSTSNKPTRRSSTQPKSSRSKVLDGSNSSYIMLEGNNSYHRRGCRLVSSSKKKKRVLLASSVLANKYMPCSVCRPAKPLKPLDFSKMSTKEREAYQKQYDSAKKVVKYIEDKTGKPVFADK